jgi:hypothetical protein
MLPIAFIILGSISLIEKDSFEQMNNPEKQGKRSSLMEPSGILLFLIPFRWN